jgi:hypothetical protein
LVNIYCLKNKFTKTELISKLKNNKNEKITFKDFLKSYYSRLSNFIFKYKNLITKIALFTILIKYLRKFKFIKIIIRIINYILLGTMGIFISDIYGLQEIIAEIEYYWMKYVNFIHESKIYKTLVKIFHLVNDENKSEVIENKSEIIEDKSKVIEDKSKSKLNNSEIPSSGKELKNEKIIHDKTSRGDTKENWFEINNYYWIALSIVSLTLIYFYWDSIMELFKNVKPDDDGSTTTDSIVFQSHEEEYKKYFKEQSLNEELYDLDVIKSQKGKSIEYIDVENTKWEDSPTPKASSSKLPETHGVMLPISKK